MRYMIITTDHQELEVVLNHHGAEGWHLVQLVPWTSMLKPDGVKLILETDTPLDE